MTASPGRRRRWDARCSRVWSSDGDEVVLDAGCGSGRVTEALLERLPRGSVIAVDASASMACAARERLGAWRSTTTRQRPPGGPGTGLGGRVDVRVLDLLELDLERPVDAIFSTATFHWIADHEPAVRAPSRRAAPRRPAGGPVRGGGQHRRPAREGERGARGRPLREHFADWQSAVELRRTGGDADAPARGRVRRCELLACAGAAAAGASARVPLHDRARPARPAPARGAARAVHGRRARRRSASRSSSTTCA